MKKLNKNIFICALLVLMLFVCVNAASASDSLNQEIASDVSPTEDVSLSSSVDNEVLSESGNTLIVDSNDGGDYRTISDAVGNATGGETIFIRNGEYSEANTIVFSKSLSLVGESQDGVKVTGASKSLFNAVEPALVLSFTNMTILNAGGSSNAAFKFTYSAHEISIINCTMDNCGSKWGTIQFGHSGTGVVDNCKILNSKATVSASCEAIYISGAGTYEIRNTLIDSAKYTVTSSYTYGAIYVSNANARVLIDNTTFRNGTGTSRGIIYNSGILNVTNSRFEGNNLSKYNTQSNSLICTANNAKTTIEQCEFADNICIDQLFTNVGDNSNTIVNYCNIQNNIADGIFNSKGISNFDANYWGANSLPEGITASSWIIDDNGVYKYNTGEPLDKIIPGLNDGPVVVTPIYVATNGSDDNDGLSPEAAVATIQKAVELANGKIILLNGTYALSNNINIDKNLEIAGDGDVTINTNSKTISNGAVLSFNNIIFRNAITASAITNTGTLSLLNCTFTANIGGANGIVNSKSGSKLNVDNCRFVNNVRTGQNPSVNVIIIDSCEATIINSEISNNQGQNSFPVTIKGDSIVMIDNCNFKSNAYVVGYGGALSIGGNSKVLITNSNFIENRRSTPQVAQIPAGGAAIYQFGNADVTINRCNFAGNLASTIQGAMISDTGIYITGGTLDVSYSAFINPEGNTLPAILTANSPSVTANYNWWGSNDGANTAVPVDNWVILTADYEPTVVEKGDIVTITAAFDKYMDTSGYIDYLAYPIADGIEVSFTSTSGNLSEVVTTEDSVASVKYTVNMEDKEFTVTSAKETIILPVTVLETIIYVSPEGSDENNGSYDAPVKTLAKAIELSKGKIYLLAGTYTINATLVVNKDVDIEGLGDVVIDGNSTRIMENTANLILTNIAFTNAKSGFGSVLLDDGNATIVGCTFYSNSATGSSGNIINNRAGSLTVDDCKFYENVAKRGVIGSQSGTTLNINNSYIHDNDMTSLSATYGIIYAATAETVIENTIFINNKVQKGGAIYANGASGKNPTVIINNCLFANNTALTGDGGAVHASGTVIVKISDSAFVNNTATKGAYSGGNGGALYVSNTADVTVDKSIFMDNSGVEDAGIHIAGTTTSNPTFTISNSILLAKEGDSAYALFKTDEERDEKVNANDNWWGDNTKANTNAKVDRWVMMEAAYNPANVVPGDKIEISVSFTRYNSTSGIGELQTFIHDGIAVTISTNNGLIDEEELLDGNAATSYVLNDDDNEIIVKLLNREVVLPVEFIDLDVVYVSVNGDDANAGTKDSPVATIERALALTSKNNVVLLEGTYKLSNLAAYDKLTLTGEGNAIIDADNNGRVLYVGSEGDVTLANLTLINGFTTEESGALLGNSGKLTIINCTLASSTSGLNGGAIYNVGKLTVINTTIANNTAKLGGAIYADKYLGDESVVIINSTFYNNLATGNNNKAGGAIYAQAFTGEFTIKDTTFDSNKAGTGFAGGAIYGLQLGNVKIDGSSFIGNTADPAEGYGGGAITFIGANFNSQGTLTITNTLFEDNYAPINGAAIFVKSSTLNIANSVLLNNMDENGYAIYRYDTSYVTATVTANDNWWGSNEDPSSYINKGTLTRWATLTITNDTPIVEGNTVRITVSINNYTTKAADQAIDVARPVTIVTTFGNIEGVLENGEFSYDYVVPAGLKYIAASVDDEYQILYAIISETTVGIDNITGKKYGTVTIDVNVTTDGAVVNAGLVELYIDDEFIDVIPVVNGTASTVLFVTKDIGEYNLTAKFIDESQQFASSNATSTFTVDGLIDLTNDTFFIFFDENGKLRPEITVDELIFNGPFSNLGVSVITINKPIVIGGNDAVLYDMAYAIASDDVTLANITLIADGFDFATNNHALININNVMDATLENLTISFVSPNNVDAYAIYANKATGFELFDSTIFFDSNMDVDVHQHGIEIRDCEEVLIYGNKLDATLPPRGIAWYGEEGINKHYPLAIGIQGGNGIVLSENEINVIAEATAASWPSLDVILADGFTNLVISKNNITQIDIKDLGIVEYLYTVELDNFEGALVEYNNVLVNTTTGTDSSGAAYPIHTVGPYTDLTVDHNNLTAIGRGPVLGIDAYNAGQTSYGVYTNNIIDVTGYAGLSDWGLVAGMQVIDTLAKIYDNTIYAHNFNSYNDGNYIFGIAFAQYGNDIQYDIQNNTIISEGKYAVYLGSASSPTHDSNVIGNILYGHELTGDAAAVAVGEGNVIENNFPQIPTEFSVEATDAFVGGPTTVIVTVPDATGTVTIKVNNKEYEVNLTDGVAVKEIYDYGDNLTVFATFNGDLKYFPISGSTTFEVLDNIVFNDTFYKYFNEFGNLRDEVPFEELIFKGEFSDLASCITIPRAITITGEDAVLYDIGFAIPGVSNVKLDNMVLIADGFFGDLIDIAYSSGVTVSNMGIVYTTEDPGSAIHVYESSNINIINNSVFFESTVDDYAVDEMTNAICIEADIDMMDAMMGDIEYTSSDIVVDNNNITAIIPAFLCDAYEHEYYVMGLSAVNGVRINGIENIEFTNNNLNVNTNRLDRTTPTFQALYIAACYDSLVSGNNISMIDTFTPEGKDIYLYAMEVIYDTDLVISNNKFDIATNGGKADAGAAYAIQAVASEFSVISNNITTESNGPNIGIYFPARMGAPCEVMIIDNIISVTGLSTTQYTGLVTGIEVQTGTFEISGNTIYTYDIGDFNENNIVYGISYDQDGSVSEVEITNNTVVTVGHYAISFIKTDDAIITDNCLISNDLLGDDAVQIKAGDDNVVENNYPFKANLTVNASDIIVGEDAVIEVSLNENAVGIVTVSVNGKSYTVTNIVNGKGNVTISNLPVNGYDVVATFETQTIKYWNDEAETSFKVSKIESNITVIIPEELISGDDFDINITIPGATGIVSVIIDGKEQKVPLVNGNVLVPVENITAGSHNIVVIYNGDENHNFEYVPITFDVDKRATEIELDVVDSVYGEPVVIIAYIDAVGDVIISVDGVDYNVEIIEGVATLTVPYNLTTGDYVVIAEYLENTEYYGSEDIDFINIEGLNATFDVEVDTAKIGHDAFVVVELPEDAEGIVTVTVGDKTYEDLVEEGIAIVNVPDLPLGQTKLDVKYSGDGKYAPNETTVTATIVPLTVTRIAVTVINETNITAVLLDYDDNPIVDAIVSYSIDGGEVINLTTDDNGEFRFVATGCNITMAFAGDSEYKGTTQFFKFDALPVVRQATDIDVELEFTRYANDYNAGERGGMFYFTLRDGDGNIMTNKSAKIGINGVIYNVVTDSEGKAGLQINLAKSTAYTYAIAYLGDDEYNASFAVSKLNLVKKPLTITPKKTSYTFTATAKNKYVEATLSTIKNEFDGKMYLSEGKKVTLTIDGKTYSATAGKNGAIKFNLGSFTKKGTYKVTINYAGDGTYDTATSKQITIKLS